MKDKELNALVIERDKLQTRKLFNQVMHSLKIYSVTGKLPEIVAIHTETMLDVARYILPTVTVGKSDLSWVSVPARNSIKDGYRQASMKVVYVEPSRMWSTDGVSIFVVYDHDQKTMGCLEPFSLLPIEDREPVQIDRIINVEPNMQTQFFYKQIETVAIHKTIDYAKIPGTDDLFDRKVIEGFVQPGQIWELIYRESGGLHMFRMLSKKKSKRVVAAMPLRRPYEFDEKENQ